MAATISSSSTSKNTKRSSSLRHSSVAFPAILEDESKEECDRERVRGPRRSSSRDRSEVGNDRSVSFTACNPTIRENTTDINHNKIKFSPDSSPNPNSRVFKSIFNSLRKKSPSPRPSPRLSDAKEENGRLSVSDLSQKLSKAIQQRDQALIEASKLKNSVSELEKKLDKLEIYCDDLKSALNLCTSSYSCSLSSETEKIERLGRLGDLTTADTFVSTVLDARSAIRHLSRSIAFDLRQTGMKLESRICSLLKPYGGKVSFSSNPRNFIFCIEALMNQIFYEDFETSGFQRNSCDLILDPVEKCQSNLSSFRILRGIGWDEILVKGTKRIGDEFSGFCDRKMSGIVESLSWNNPWNESLLRAFFGAAKGVWSVHLLAGSVHPSWPIYRVESASWFDRVYMEEVTRVRTRDSVLSRVRVMISPGFYVVPSVIKCKVLCAHSQEPSEPDP